MSLVEFYDPTEKNCADLLSCGFDVPSYLKLVDRLAVRLGGEKEYRRAARLVCEAMMDLRPADPEPQPEWFDEWWNSREIDTLCRNVFRKLSEMIDDISEVNNDPDSSCYIDEGWAYDCRIMDLDEVATETIDKIEGINSEGLYEMANFLRVRHPELPANIWIAAKADTDDSRMRIQRNKNTVMQIGNSFCMTISNSPSIVGDLVTELSAQDIDYLKGFIVRNKETLLAYWNGTLDTSDLAGKLIF